MEIKILNGVLTSSTLRKYSKTMYKIGFNPNILQVSIIGLRWPDTEQNYYRWTKWSSYSSYVFNLKQTLLHTRYLSAMLCDKRGK